MDDRAANPPATCPECGADDPLIGGRCWLCGAVLPDGAAQSAGNAPENAIASSTRHTFSLISLFLVMTLAAVCLGVFAAAPGLGLVLALVATPARVRTMVVVSRQTARWARPSPAQKIWAFAASAGVLILVIVAVGAAFCAACFISLLGASSALRDTGAREAIAFVLFVLLGLSVLVGVAVTGALAIIIWGRKKG